MKKRILSILLTVCLLMALLPTVAFAEGSVTYLDADGTLKTSPSATEVTSSDTEWTDTTTNPGWYVVNTNVTIGTEETPQRVTVSGDVRLILTDGCTLTVNGGIQVQDDDEDITNGSANALTIYAQSTDESTMGKLIAKGAERDYNAVIGGNEGNGYGGSGGAITINGGVVKATNTGGAGIGGGFGDYGGSGGEVTITGGTVTATGNARGNTSAYIIGVEGIGGGRYDITSGTDGTFQTTNNGNAVIFASSIGDQSHKADWSGIIFEGDEGKVYGNPTLADDLTIPENKALDIPSGKTLTVNSKITVQGTLTNNGTIIGSGSITPDAKKLTYKAAPSTPVIDSVSADSITLQPIVGETAVEYSKDNTNWQSGTTFSGLTAATSYTFYARYQENGFYKGASPQSGGNAPAYTAYAAPVTNEGYSIDYAAETITVSDGYEVNTDSGFGTGTVVTSGSTVTPGQTFHVRKAASGDIPASEGTEFTIPARPDAPAAPTVKSKTSGSVTLEVILGAQYSMDGGATWQDSPEFTGLSASTAYRFVARYGATESRFASLASAELNVTTNAALSGGGYTYYTNKATAGVNGAISPSGSVSVREGRNQTFTITPNTGYAISNVKIDGKSVGAVKSYTFENVKGNHTIEAIFMKANGNPQTGVFVDVPEGSYYEEAVAWAVENGITQGTDDTHFSPDGICTRAQAVTFLWRTAGSPASKTSAMPFTDVPVGSYYYDAVLWAVENGITKGTSETRFSPDDTCTRAQIVAFLWRSEKSPAAGSRNPFADVKSTAYYADAVLWAVKEDITKGSTNTTFSPDADCTRAQIVTFLWRCKK